MACQTMSSGEQLQACVHAGLLPGGKLAHLATRMTNPMETEPAEPCFARVGQVAFLRPKGLSRLHAVKEGHPRQALPLMLLQLLLALALAFYSATAQPVASLVPNSTGATPPHTALTVCLRLKPVHPVAAGAAALRARLPRLCTRPTHLVTSQTGCAQRHIVEGCRTNQMVEMVLTMSSCQMCNSLALLCSLVVVRSALARTRSQADLARDHCSSAMAARDEHLMAPTEERVQGRLATENSQTGLDVDSEKFSNVSTAQLAASTALWSLANQLPYARL
mmetsp:Transcript_45828/g.106499  ORF Transcript_45828/g.106499 Transcript_45828/m.106499 type:complete len:278 (+) Transcript_45828:353-1186(+)